MHLRSNKVYQGLKELIKKRRDKFCGKCLTCQQVKAKHQFLSGLFQLHTIPQWKWERITMDGLPLSLIRKDSMWDQDPRFTSRFWKKLHKALGAKHDFSATFHPQTKRQSGSTIKILKDIWVEFLPLAEFAYSNSYQASINTSPYETLYGRKCCTPLC
ncbi:DNA/RNA polymerases superfamily protein [Gossypium australe]|uniref:DNA/RNA polymerases superfamily protein n=1 Tax=Gossypium australe TaxID=47621 RepID=A0A5B6WN22_9ROSI|nr:DNA/RNA polymerases superfamily protein [Gossypium australe]